MVDINASMTDGTGKEIVEALRGLGGNGNTGSSNNGQIMILRKVSEYPGDVDPYADLHPSGNEWLDKTWGEIRDAFLSGKIVILRDVPVETTNFEGHYDINPTSFSGLDRVTTRIYNSSDEVVTRLQLDFVGIIGTGETCYVTNETAYDEYPSFSELADTSGYTE